MNCFQKLLSSWRGTTIAFRSHILLPLWIAFKNYYLRDEEQPPNPKATDAGSCELLSKIIIFVTRNNFEFEYDNYELVVNCFQKLLSSWRGTTPLTILVVSIRCELLSKIIIFVTRNNQVVNNYKGFCVVNCFQKLLSSWRGTTIKVQRLK